MRTAGGIRFRVLDIILIEAGISPEINLGSYLSSLFK
jgi:hypothetical protein